MKTYTVFWHAGDITGGWVFTNIGGKTFEQAAYEIGVDLEIDGVVIDSIIEGDHRPSF